LLLLWKAWMYWMFQVQVQVWVLLKVLVLALALVLVKADGHVLVLPHFPLELKE
jgi:hypothetical protein